MTEPQPAEGANEQERKKRTSEVATASKTPVHATAPNASKEETRSGLRTQGAVEVVAAEKPAFVRVYNKAPNLDRRFDAVDMDEKPETGGPIPPVTGPVIKPTEAERTVMPPDEPPAPPKPLRKPAEIKEARQGSFSESKSKEEASEIEKPTPTKTKNAEATESDEEPAP